jgi:hypothetical protein
MIEANRRQSSIQNAATLFATIGIAALTRRLQMTHFSNLSRWSDDISP